MREFAPPTALLPFVDRFWFRSADEFPASTEPHRVLPDGCLDIVLGPKGAIVVGAMTRPILVAPADGSGLLGVRFRPGMATAFLRLPAAALTDDRAPLEAIWPDASAVADYVGSAPDPDQAIARIAETLTARLPHVSEVPRELLAAVDRIVACGGRIDIARLAASLGVTRQHLARRFAGHVGVSPKMLCRVVRLWQVLGRLRSGPVSWAVLAADLGYSDQSHLVSEFRSLTGLTPSRWIADCPAGSKSPRRCPGPAVS